MVNKVNSTGKADGFKTTEQHAGPYILKIEGEGLACLHEHSGLSLPHTSIYKAVDNIAPDKRSIQRVVFLIFPQNMLRVLIRNASMSNF